MNTKPNNTPAHQGDPYAAWAGAEKRLQNAETITELRTQLSALRERVARAEILVAWLDEKLSEGQAAKLIGVDRLTLRTMRDEFVAAALKGGQG